MMATFVSQCEKKYLPKTRHGALLFDVLDLIKATLILPGAFIVIQSSPSSACIEGLSLDSRYKISGMCTFDYI